MSEKNVDPKYGHLIGEYKCKVKDCQGHRKSWSADLHRIYAEHYKTARQERKKRREQKLEKKLLGVTTRIAGKTFHYHKGRRGCCSCGKRGR